MSSAHFLWGLPGSFNARPSRVELGWYWESDEAGSGVAGPASEPSAFDKRVQTPVNFTQTAFDRSLVIFGELSHKFVPSCCRNLLGRGGRKKGKAGRKELRGGRARRLAEARAGRRRVEVVPTAEPSFQELGINLQFCPLILNLRCGCSRRHLGGSVLAPPSLLCHTACLPPGALSHPWPHAAGRPFPSSRLHSRGMATR